ncbi:hypothetical protein PIB30_033678 [Stylosanthes scabra]|uniref:BRO1 domain-containing protein n=1 Tax=Stylosanthes scabra TaxID=79078 RepID=A0ABU6VEJ1_9FABA|nr:hypothetical protein [Stylosanthes scabra]
MSNDKPRLLNPETMLSIPVKKSDPVYLYGPLRKLVARKYSESDAQKVESILETLNKCRMDIVEQREELSLPMQCDCLIHYLKCLCIVEPLFTAISSDKDADPNALIFFWYDAFYSQHEHGVSSQRNSIQLEKASILFNLGAIYSQIGASCDRNTDLGRHLAMDAFSAASNIFLKLWKNFGKDISATLDLTVLFPESLHNLFSAQASELELQQELDNTPTTTTSVPLSKNINLPFCSERSVLKAYRRAYYLIRLDSPAYKHVSKYDRTWIIHLYEKTVFFQAEFLYRQSSILTKPELPEASSLVQSCPLDHDAESVTGKLVRGICCMTSLFQSCPPPDPDGKQRIPYLLHNIHLEKASVLFNLGAVCNNISLSCDLTTIQGHCVAMDALNDASYWFYLLLKLDTKKASATIDLPVDCIQMLHKIITAQIADLKENYPRSHSDGSSFPGYPVTLHYRKVYDLLTFGPLAGKLVESSIPQFIEGKMKTCHVKTGASDVTEQFLSGYCEAQSLLGEGYQTSWLDLLSEVGPFKIQDGNLVANKP